MGPLKTQESLSSSLDTVITEAGAYPGELRFEGAALDSRDLLPEDTSRITSCVGMVATALGRSNNARAFAYISLASSIPPWGKHFIPSARKQSSEGRLGRPSTQSITVDSSRTAREWR